MLWKVLVPLCLLSLSGFASGDEDFEYIGKRKLMSVDTEDKTESEEAVTENNTLEEKIEDQTQGEEVLVTESQKEKRKEEKEEEEDKPEIDILEIDKRENDKPENEKPETPKNDTLENSIPENDKPELEGQSPSKRITAPWDIRNTYFHLYTRNQPVQIVQPANGWFKNFVPDRDLVILVHGVVHNYKYVKDFFDTLSYALLNESNYNIIAVEWLYHVYYEGNPNHFADNLHYVTNFGHTLYNIFERHFPEFFSNSLNTYYIGQDLGTIPPIILQQAYGKRFRYVYGLDPRIELPYAKDRLAKEHGEVVAILSTNEYPYPYGHKNIYALPYRSSLPSAHRILAKAIGHGRKTATFCSNAEYFQLGYCNKLPEVPIWFTHSHSTDKSYPTGSYYFYESPYVTTKSC